MRIIKYPNPTLREKAKTISAITPEIVKLGKKMIKLMEENDGAGLAANQVGKLIRLIVFRDGDHSRILINPKICKSSSEKATIEEGCLSFPGLYGEVERPKKVRVQGKNENGGKVKLTAENLASVSLQHEIDHLDGVLFIDKVKPETLRQIEPKDLENLKKD
ncbi:MAG TPA: peptide deformylase [Patescibacteria group bacterium]|nr:peptide deformylase [Patescibacteria group bacterium]